MSELNRTDLTGVTVQCPTCGDIGDADKIWIWTSSAAKTGLHGSRGDEIAIVEFEQAEHLRVISGGIAPPERGRPVRFELACRCTFDTSEWTLHLRATASSRRGGTLRLSVRPLH